MDRRTFLKRLVLVLGTFLPIPGRPCNAPRTITFDPSRLGPGRRWAG